MEYTRMITIKYFLAFAVIVTVFFITACTTTKKAEYDFPVEMGETVRADYKKQCDKGQVLYMINCAGCHNVKSGRKMVIPDFTPEKLASYEVRVANAKHESNLDETKVSAEELGMIMTFLTYKKRINVKNAATDSNANGG